MRRLTFIETEAQTLLHKRFHHSHPHVRRKMEALWLKSQGLAHQEAITTYFCSHPPASINEAVDAIRDLTGLTRSPTQVRLFLKEKCGMKRLKTGALPAKADPDIQEAV